MSIFAKLNVLNSLLIAKINAREIFVFQIREIKCPRKLVRIRYCKIVLRFSTMEYVILEELKTAMQTVTQDTDIQVLLFLNSKSFVVESIKIQSNYRLVLTCYMHLSSSSASSSQAGCRPSVVSFFLAAWRDSTSTSSSSSLKWRKSTLRHWCLLEMIIK